jgi:hypothetical protein
MLNSVKEKSWSVLLIKGHVLNNQVRAERCENCKSTSKVLTTNFSNPNLLLYGCKDSKCRHRLLRLDFNDEITPKLSNSSVDKKKAWLKANYSALTRRASKSKTYEALEGSLV